MISRKDELRIIFKDAKTPRISGAQLVALLRSVGLQVPADTRKAIADAFNAHGGFYCEDFISIAESLGFSETAPARVAEALRTLEYKDSVNLVDLQRNIHLCGKAVGLTEEETSVFLVFQLGAEALSKGRIPYSRSLDLIN